MREERCRKKTRFLLNCTTPRNDKKSSAGQRLASAEARLVSGLRLARHIIGCRPGRQIYDATALNNFARLLMSAALASPITK
jgi:hypothetical protein